MSLIDIARDTLKEIPMADILRERLSMAIDRLADAESKIESLQAEKGGFQAQLERELSEHQKTRNELERLKSEHLEEVRVHRFIEFRRGKRTSGKWAAFCPKCHMPVSNLDGDLDVTCSDEACKWRVRLENIPLSQAIR